VESRLVGDRKGGLTLASSPLVRAAVAATRVVGRVPMLNYSSTDANVPIALGIPGIAMGAGGRGDRAHSLDEWVDVDKASSMPGLERALLVTLYLAGVVE
jgi:acetylornithine deacetylase/succinyl-diaminopimelate desuccinylase-like protein